MDWVTKLVWTVVNSHWQHQDEALSSEKAAWSGDFCLWRNINQEQLCKRILKFKYKRLEKKKDRCADVKSGKKLQRENKVGEGESVILQGGFPEVTALNITQECGMLNRCQSKHTGHATAAPNDCQGLLYTHTLSCILYMHKYSLQKIYIKQTHNESTDQTVSWRQP